MPIYTYCGNKEPGDATAALEVSSGIIGIGEYGELTTGEYNRLSQLYDLRPGIVTGISTPAYPLVPGHSSTSGPASSSVRTLVVVNHGTNASASRPGYPVVMWVGSVDPANKQTGDLWVRTA